MIIKKLGIIVSIVFMGSMSQGLFAMDDSRAIQNLINVCGIIRSNPNADYNEAKDWFTDVTGFLNKQPSQEQLSKRHHFFQFSSYEPDWTLFHCLVLPKTNAPKEKKEAIDKYCDCFGDKAYTLFHLSDLSGTPLIHRIFERGDAEIIPHVIKTIEVCQKSGYAGTLDVMAITDSLLQHNILHKAVCYNNVKAIDLFLKNAAPLLVLKLIGQGDFKGEIPLQLAQRIGKDKISQLLLSYIDNNKK